MSEYAGQRLIGKRIERGLKRARRYARWKHNPNRKLTAAELARKYRREVLKKV